MPEEPPPSDPRPDALAAGALALLADLARIAVDLDDPSAQRAVDEALLAACDRARSWL